MQKGSGRFTPHLYSKWPKFKFFFYENSGEVGSLNSPIPLSKVVGVDKKLVTEYLQNKPRDNLHRNLRVRGNHY